MRSIICTSPTQGGECSLTKLVTSQSLGRHFTYSYTGIMSCEHVSWCLSMVKHARREKASSSEKSQQIHQRPMPSAKKKRQQKAQTRLGSLNPSTMNTCFVAPSPNATASAGIICYVMLRGPRTQPREGKPRRTYDMRRVRHGASRGASL